MRLRDVFQPPNRHHSHQGHAPFADHGRLFVAHCGQVRRHAEGKGAEEGAAAADQSVESGQSSGHGAHGTIFACGKQTIEGLYINAYTKL